VTQGKVISGGPAKKVEEASKRLEKVVSLDGNTDNDKATTTTTPKGGESVRECVPSVGMEYLAGLTENLAELTDNAAKHPRAEVISEADDGAPFARMYC